MRSNIYKLYHYPLEMEYFFHRKPQIFDMVKILKKLGYTMKGNKIVSDNNNISCRDHSVREEFKISKLKFED